MLNYGNLSEFVAPVFYYEGHAISENQVRYLMLSVAKKERETATITDMHGNVANILPTGHLSRPLSGMDDADTLAVWLHNQNQ